MNDSRTIHTGSGQRGAGTKGRRQVDAHSRQGTAPLAGKSLAGADRPGASARVGALRCRWEPGYGWKHGEAHHGGAPTPRVSETTVTRADAPRVLEYKWGDFDMRWELEAFGGGTRLTLWTNIGRRFISMGAAGWHICFDVLDRLLAGQSIGRIVGPEAMKFEGWQRLNAEYAKQFGVEMPRAGRLRRLRSRESGEPSGMPYGRVHLDPRRAREQSQRRHAPDSQAQADDLHRRIGLGQIVDRVRHARNGSTAPALRELLALHPQLPAEVPAARRRRDRKPHHGGDRRPEAARRRDRIPRSAR